MHLIGAIDASALVVRRVRSMNIACEMCGIRVARSLLAGKRLGGKERNQTDSLPFAGSCERVATNV